MSYGGQIKDSEGHYYAQKKKKADRLAGSVAVANTAVILQGIFYTTGPFRAETILVSNPTAGVVTYIILDGAVVLASASVAANAILTLTPINIPFFTSVQFNSNNVNTVCVVGGYIP